MSFLRHFYCAALATLFLCRYSFAQTIPDSLLHKLNNTTDDSVRARTLLDIGENIEAGFTTESFGYYQRALALSKKIKNNHLLLSALNDVGICYIELNKLDSAVTVLWDAVLVARLLKDSGRVARVLGNIGNVYLHKKDRAAAIGYYLKSVRLLENNTDQTGLNTLYSNIASLFNDQKEYNQALEFGLKAVNLAVSKGDEYSEASALINLSDVYGNLDQPGKQYELLEKALPLAKKYGDLDQIASVYHDMGAYFYAKKDYSLSLEKYLNSYTYVKQMGNKYHLCTACAVLAQVYYKLNQKVQALQYILQAEKLADEVGARADLKEIYLTRGEIEQQAGHYKMAAEYFSKAIVLKDSLFKAETSEKVADAEAKYQNEKKQQAITQLEKDKQIQALSLKQKSILNYFLIAAFAVLLLFIFLSYRNIRHRHILAAKEAELQRQRIRELEKDKQLVSVEAMLKGQEEERSRLARDLHDGLGGLLSGVKFSLRNMKDNLIITPDNMAVFERSLDMIDNSIRELRRVAHNMMPEMLTKFGLDEALREYCNTINSAKILSIKYVSLGMESRLENSTEIIIYRIIQELLNNTMKHAAATEVLVQLIKQENRLNIVVEDNGKGFDTRQMELNKGAGLVNVRSRVDYLKGQLEIHAKPGNGTLINIEFNL